MDVGKLFIRRKEIVMDTNLKQTLDRIREKAEAQMGVAQSTMESLKQLLIAGDYENAMSLYYRESRYGDSDKNGMLNLIKSHPPEKSCPVCGEPLLAVFDGMYGDSPWHIAGCHKCRRANLEKKLNEVFENVLRARGVDLAYICRDQSDDFFGEVR